MFKGTAMARDPRYDILFEPVKIGPVTAPNRFYQVPHCSGMGSNMPDTLNRMREIKAEGGWGVVCTEYCSIHPTSDDEPWPHCTMWDDGDAGWIEETVEFVRHGHVRERVPSIATYKRQARARPSLWQIF